MFQKTFGGTGSDIGQSVRQTSNGGYIICGQTNSSGGWNVYLLETDANGNLQWNRNFGNTGPSSGEFAVQVLQTTAGEYVTYGGAFFGSQRDYVVKADAGGNLLWSKVINVANGGANGWGLQQTTDGGYVLSSGMYQHISVVGPTSGFDMNITKIDGSGNFQWTRSFSPSANFLTEGGRNLRQTSDGGFIVVGFTENIISPSSTFDIFVVKVDSAGNLQWGKVYGGSGSDQAMSVMQTPDGGYLVGGLSASFSPTWDGLFIKTDSLGNVQWAKTYGGAGVDAFYWGLEQTNDGGFITTGYSDSFGAGAGDAYLVKTDSSGNLQWSYTYGGTGTENGDNVSQTNDGGYIVTGQTNSFGAGGTDVYLIKTDSTGASGCNEALAATIVTNVTPTVVTPAILTATGGTATTPPTVVTTPVLTDTSLCILCVTVANAGPDATICAGDNATLTASGGGTYLWNTGATNSTIVVNPTSTTAYSVTVTDTCGLAIDSVMVTVSPSPTASVSGNTTICSGQNTMLTASGGSSYSWSNGATTSSVSVAPAVTTSYTVTVTDTCGLAIDSVMVTVSPSPTASVSGNTTICSGQNTMLTASGGSSYSWTTGATTAAITVFPTTNTTYSVIVFSGSCSDTATATITVSSPPVATASGNITICIGDVVALTASGGGNYSWSNGQTTNPISVSPSSSTTYSVIVSIGNCTDTASSTVTVNNNPVANAGADVTILIENNTTLNASGGSFYSWSPATGLSCTNCQSPTAAPSVTTEYCVFVTDANGCTDSACITINVDISCSDIYLPNAFSPNGDNENDELQIYFGDSLCIKSLNIVIYNRWGEKVFESDESNFKWDGMYKGKKPDSGVFVYHLKGTLKDGREIERKGNISLIR